MAMTHKQRIIAAARKQPVDKLPFGARIDLWYNYHSANDTLPEKYKGWSIVEVNRDLGAGTQLRLQEPWKEEYRNMEVVVGKEPPFTTTEYRTPAGRISKKIKFDPKQGVNVEQQVEYLFKSEEDYPALEHVIENTTFVPDYEQYRKLEALAGEDGVVTIGKARSPMQMIMQDIMGYEKSFHELFDNRQKVKHLYEVIKEQWQAKLKIIADSPSEFPILCGNWSDSIHTPVFKEYFTPWFQEVCAYLHSRGKLAAIHIDGEMKRLIPFVLETGIDVGECFSPVPMTSVTTAEVREAWGDKVTIWGGVPAQFFLPEYSDEEFDARIIDLFKDVAPGNNFIVGMGENMPFNGKIERVRRIAELIDKHGILPIAI
ncbi:MAG: uroporphyrinogen decarboxylase family protein [Dehalococcoidales bacterium]